MDITTVIRASKNDLRDFNLKRIDNRDFIKDRSPDQWDLIYYKNNIEIYYFNYKNLEGYCVKNPKDSYIIELNGFNGFDSGIDNDPIMIKNNQTIDITWYKVGELSDFTFKFEKDISDEDIEEFIKIIEKDI